MVREIPRGRADGAQHARDRHGRELPRDDWAIGAARHAELVGRRVERAVARRLEELKANLEGEGLWRDDVAHAGAAH